jgi:putative transposase
MKDIGSLSHTKWECKYHVVFIPKYRRKAMYQEIRQYLKDVFHDLARQRECRIRNVSMILRHFVREISVVPPE